MILKRKKMKREILFRGLRTDGGGWVYGYYYTGYCFRSYFKTESENLLSHKIMHEPIAGHSVESSRVIPETIGQFTGLTDKNDDKILLFEGDLLSLDGKILGNKHETEIHKRETHIIIPSITSKDWLSAYTFAVDRGFRHA